MTTTTVLHVLVMPANISEENYSFFQGFSRQLFGEYAGIFSALSDFPHDILEIYLEGNDYVTSKMIGSSLDVFQIR